MSEKSVTLSQAIEGYTIHAHARRLSVNTVVSYEWAFRRLESVVGRDKALASITTKEIRMFIASLSDLSNKSVVNAHVALSALWTWGVGEGLVPSNIVREVRPPKAEIREVMPFGALASTRFVHPADCQSLCDAPEGALCPTGACRPEEQRAGLPLPVLVDDPGGGSPTGGWGVLGPEDLPNPFTFALDVLFYSVVIWLVYYIGQLVLGKGQSLELIALMLPIALILACVLLGYYLYQPFPTR